MNSFAEGVLAGSFVTMLICACVFAWMERWGKRIFDSDQRLLVDYSKQLAKTEGQRDGWIEIANEQKRRVNEARDAACYLARNMSVCLRDASDCYVWLDEPEAVEDSQDCEVDDEE